MMNIIHTFRRVVRIGAIGFLAATSVLVLQAVAVNAQNLSDTSLNWSGYVASNAGTYTSVTGTWTIPTVPNSYQLGADASWVGIGGVTSNDLIQAGTQEITGQGSSTIYEAWIETLPNDSQPVPLSIKAGDSVTVTITKQSGNLWAISMKNNTTGQSYQTSTVYDSSLSSAEWIEEAPMSGNSLVPLDNFGTVQFSNTSTVVNGNTVSLADSGATAMTMLNSFGQSLATASAIGSDNSSFSVTKSATASNIPYQTTRTFSTGGRNGLQGFQRKNRTSSGFTTVPVTIPKSTSSTTTSTSSTNGRARVYTFQVPGFGAYVVYLR